ncbi:peptide ABC transporter permease [Tersicoccus solisilvae]|uniref:Peptide ABC transporter permease n=1 Tax=Tersicoccus solisilvae TaxID=1882339 RepID=A0ABQ1NKL1_9MICC|nr:ABC transporter permease [Tersicoccus solisilvae]GGC79637.1 peptide ABC transporter permease [Tersicoccus solisilvae]
MLRFLLTRLGLLLVALWVTSVLIFLALRVLPGDVAQVIGGTTATPQQLAAIRAGLGLDDPLIVQYLHWIGGVLRLDLGTSLLTGVPVADELAQKMQVTVPLAVLSLVIALLVALPLGVIAAVRRHHPDGGVLGVVGQLFAAVPAVWAGMMFIAVFALGLGLFPAQGFPLDGWHRPWQALHSLMLPALTIGIVEGAVLLRFVRSATLTALGQDHVRTAAAKGMTRTRALVTHGLPSVGLSIISVLGLQVAGLIVGAVVIEQLFALPGLGRMLVADVGNRDLPKVQSTILVLTALVLIVGTAVDVVHRLIDPRQRETVS